MPSPLRARCARCNVAVGDTVKAGRYAGGARFHDADAGVVEAQAAIFRAQANLDELKAGPRTQEVAAAEANVQAAQARLDQLSTPASDSEIAAARSSLAAAQAALNQLSAGPRQEERIAALADLANAEAVLKQAQSAYNQVKDRNDVGMLPQSRDLQQATNNYEAAQARYDLLFAGPEADAVAAGRAQVQQAQAALDRLLTPATPSQVAEAQAQVRSAQAQLDLLQAGARDQDAGRRRRRRHRSRGRAAPGAGRPGSDGDPCAVCRHRSRHLPSAPAKWCSRVQVVLTLADLAMLQVETTDLSERDVTRVAVGRPATVIVQASNEQVPGKVTAIAPASTDRRRRRSLCRHDRPGSAAGRPAVGHDGRRGDRRGIDAIALAIALKRRRQRRLLHAAVCRPQHLLDVLVEKRRLAQAL